MSISKAYNSKVINMFGGAGAGKSTIAAELFANMKKRGMSVELVTEVAKDIVHEGRMGNMMSCQDKISADQNFRQYRVNGQYEYIITDSPVLLGIFYTPPNYYPSFQRLVIEKFQSYNNINIYLDREAKYDPRGRYQDEEGANKLSATILNYLKSEGIPFYRLPANDTTVDTIVKYLAVHDQKEGMANLEKPTIGKYRDQSLPRFYLNGYGPE